jgi:hypothetical protein
MWNAMFDLQLSLGEKVIRAVVIYLFLVIALRLVGKRELTQLNTLDFVVLLAVANAVQNGLIGADNTVTGAVVGATTLFPSTGPGLASSTGAPQTASWRAPDRADPRRQGPRGRAAQRGDDPRRPAGGDPGRGAPDRRRVRTASLRAERQGRGHPESRPGSGTSTTTSRRRIDHLTVLVNELSQR